MAQYTQRTQPMHRGAGTEHGGGGGGALAYGGGGKAAGGVVATPAPRAPPPAPYAPQNYPPAQLRLHQPGYGSAALTYTRDSYGRGGGAVGDYRTGGTRMSLLGTAYLTPPPSAHHPPPADPPPFKKIRLTENRAPITALPHHQPLRVDTREQVNAYGTVEVLSPNPPSEPTVEDQSFRTTKDDLLQQISKVDREMALSDHMLSKLKNKMEQLQQSTAKPASKEEPEEAVPRHRSLAQCVYNDNRKKAAAAHALLAHLGPAVTYPLYNQPQDTEAYHENIRKHRGFRKRLVEHLKRVKLEQDKREASIAEEYSRRLAEWSRRVERIEQGQKRKAKDARNREFFEKVFPELRKQREERERFNRLGARVKSEAELEEIADGLHEQEHEDKKMRSLTVVPPLLRDPTATKPQYLDTNRRCLDMKDEHKELQFKNVWSSAEREVFRDKYLQHPKNFGQIASFLPRKSVRDCVRFYYLSKKAEKYKQLLRKPRQRRTGRPRPAVEPELPPGVTTRLQRSQGGVRTSETKEGEESGAGGEVGSIPVPEQPASPSPAAPAAPARSELSRSPPPLPPSPPPASSAPPVSATATATSSCATSVTPMPLVDTPVPTSTASQQDCTSVATSTTTVTPSTTSVPSPAPVCTPTPSMPTVPTSSTPPVPAVSASPAPVVAPGSAPPTPQPATPTQPPPTPEPAVTERISTPSSTGTTTTTVTTTASAGSNCAVCGKAGATRNVSRSRAVFYGLREDAAGARVCEECHCNCVRSRYTSCLVPTCPTPRVRAKRLRHLPPRWHDLSLELKRPLMDEFQIPSDLSKCCLACFKRITRRLETIGDGGVPEPSEEEAGRFRTLLREHGAAWDRMATASGRSPASLKAFYYTYRKKFQLDALVAERVVPRGSETDSSVASSDETDSASAGSPRLPPPAPPPPRRRDEYDSSATETADEENDTPSTKLIPTSTASLTPVVSTAPAVSTPVTVTTQAPAVRNGPAQATPISVRDVVLNMIEISLMKSNQPVPPPTKPMPNKNSLCGVRSPPRSLATLSVVTSPQPRAATITPIQDNTHSGPPANDNNVQVLLIEQRDNRASTEPLLDLSVKRRQEPSYPQPQPAKPAATVYRNSVEYPAYRRQSERESPTQYNHKPKPAAPPPRPQLKQPTNPKGSITLGTPVETRFEARRTPEPKGGSITAGTPVHAHHAPDKRHLAEYYKRRSPAYFPHQPASTRPQSPSSFQNPVYSRSPYGLEQRQIIMADFITSQQMHGAGARRAGPAPQPPAQEGRSSPARYSPRPAHRETVSVIQRHTPMYPHHHPHPPPGHEAFTSLVDVASAATALPVPRDKQEHKLMPPHSPHSQHVSHNQHEIRMQERIREAAMVQKYHQQQIQFQVERDRQQRAQIIETGRQIVMQNRELQNRELQNREMQNREMQNRELQNREMQNREMQNREMQNREMQNRELQNREMQNREMQNREMQNRELQNREMQNRELQNRELQNRELQNREMQNRELQNRERERAMAAMAERQIVLEQQHPAMMHERHHAQVVSSVESERRMATSTTFTPAKRTLTPHHLERKDSRPVASAPPSVAAPAAPGGSAPPADARRANEGTLTAASLIDAIITHQISQTSDQRFPQQQGMVRETDNGVPASASERMDARVERGAMESPPSPHHTTSIKLGDLACNIITRDFRSPATNPITHHNQYAGSEGRPPADSYSNAAPPASGPNANDEWKRKHAPYLEPVSPPDHHTNRNNSNRRYVGGSGSSTTGGTGGGALTAAFDYVTHRIVEVMRSDHEAPAPQPAPTSAQPPSTAVPPNNKLFVPATYYPYSALNVPTTHHADAAGTGGGSSSAPAPPAAPPPPEPAPLMSAQYEPLSDED